MKCDFVFSQSSSGFFISQTETLIFQSAHIATSCDTRSDKNEFNDNTAEKDFQG